MMYATIRHDITTAWTPDEVVRAGRSLTAALGTIPGFISFALLDTRDGGLALIAICEEQAGVEEARRRLADWLARHLVALPREPPLLLEGEVIVQRGL